MKLKIISFSSEENNILDLIFGHLESNDIRYFPFMYSGERDLNEKKILYAPHTAKLDFLWRANKDLLNQIKINDLATYNSILNKFNSKRDEITTQNEV
jgi:hypothetical protein